MEFRRVPGRPRRPVAQGVAGMIAAVLILGGGLLAGRLLTGGEKTVPATHPSPVPSRSAI